MYKLFVKRLLDIILSGIAIVVLSPIYLIISIVVKIQMGSPILFSQDRIGKDEKIFKCFSPVLSHGDGDRADCRQCRGLFFLYI